MNKLIPLLSICLMLGSSQQILSDQHAPDLKASMSTDEYEDMGLDKLSNDELARLSKWILGQKSKPLELRVVENKVPKQTEETPSLKPKIESEETRPYDNQIIKTTIDGLFKGWTGRTVFKLSNGQIWRQRLKGSWRFEAESPEVEIKKNFMGYYIMRVADKKAVGVIRIK